MLGSAAFRTGIAPGGALAGPWVRDPLWTRARAVPSLDLRFADNKSLVDATAGASLVTFTRASSGTYVGSDGVLRSAVTNLVLRSEEFNDATWSKVNTTVTANSIAAPNGTITADTITDSNDGAATIHSTTTVNQSLTSGLSYTLSVYARAGTQLGIAFLFPAAAFTSNLNARFNISTGTIASLDSGLTGSITAVGDGWYRCTATATATTTASSSTAVQIRIATASTSFYQGNGTGTISLWGAQLEQASTAGDYIPTTSTINSAPRFDHNPTTGESLGLLVEEARTNLLLRSEEFGTTWTATRASVSTDATLAPNGTTTADKLVEDTTATNTHQLQQTVTLVANTTYTTSFYIKSGERTELRLLFTAGTDGINAAFNLSTGVATAQANTGLGVIASATLTPVGNGWFRATATGIISPLSTSATLTLRLLSSGSNSYTGDGTSGLFLWGAQLEAGAFPTSYIPTTTATVTRAADVASITGSNFSSWYNQSEGTVFANATAAVAASILPCYASIDNGTTSERLQLRRVTNGTSPSYRVVAGGQSIDSATKTIGSPTGFNSHVLAYASSNYEGACNGTLEGLTSIVNRPTATQLQIGNGAGSVAINGTIKRLTYWPTRLANSTLQAITQ